MHRMVGLKISHDDKDFSFYCSNFKYRQGVIKIYSNVLGASCSFQKSAFLIFEKYFSRSCIERHSFL